jgi:uncharacterized protein YndB with AHSA1/START domain
MRRGSFTVSAVVPAPPRDVYDAWMSGDGHAAMTGSPARVTARVGGAFSAWEGYITGKTREIDPGRRVVQSWRTTDFAEGQSDSTIEVTFAPVRGGTRVTIAHSDLPPGQTGTYRRGWKDFYFTPMKGYFRKR